MTSQSPRIYIYKITFEEVPYYYYGVHKETIFGEEYCGSPKTNKWCWELYTPKKQILQLFDFTDEGWLEAQEVENRLIRPVFNTDKWCLNECCGGVFSLDISRRNGLKNKENGTGIFSQTPEQRREHGRKNAAKNKENNVGIFSMTPEQRSEVGRRCGLKHKENGTGIFVLTPEERVELSRKNGLKSYENGTGLFGLTPEQRSENSRKSGLQHKENGTGICSLTKEEKSEAGKKSGAQRWICEETGFVSNAAGVIRYQIKRGIDTSKRRRIA